jgi:nitrite reductase/ring-hydroxylating ferredoxin subunit
LVGEPADVPAGVLRTVDAGGKPVVVARVGDSFCAVAGRCPHMSGPMGRGKLEGGVIRCPIHGSTFEMCTGRNLEWAPAIGSIRMPGWSRRLIAMGREPRPIQTYPVVEEDGKLYVLVDAASSGG